MRYDHVHVLGLATDIGRLVPVTDANATTAYDPEETAAVGQKSVAITAMPGPQLAIRAGRRALTAVRETGGTNQTSMVGLHLHTSLLSCGLDFWSLASHIRSQLGIGAGAALSVNIDAMSNSAVAATDTAATYLTARPDLDTVLITIGDTFTPPFQRFSDHGLVYGDAGAALLIGRHPGLAQLVSTASWCEPDLEGTTRPHPEAVTTHTAANLRAAKRGWLARGEARREHAHTLIRTAVAETVKAALADADLTLDEVRWVLPPFYGRNLLRRQVLEPLGLPEERTLAGLGLRVGHCGAADQILALDHLTRHNLVEPGDRVLLLGIGLGMTWTAAVLEIGTLPATEPAEKGGALAA
ncbi:3-oxoacyl-[acyl-carrier-protein] synthase III C-terminal domain-containing protein [Amycolatopsis pigmentata]|uniref:3-oxoacyl-[acyl-carrier-protein] synthase III C-terminal domain-containing protein n=1 Tax=Amycolatopsis pigmentata TaxID=450801 RepID=A0ABW5G6H3_9PSEU